MDSKKRLHCGIVFLLLIQEEILTAPVNNIQVLAKLLAVEMDKNHQTLEEATTAPETFTTPWEKEHIMTSTDTLLSEDALARLLQDILKIQKINRRTNKKGTSKGCFGVKLDRIGSVSGLGC